MKSEGTGRERRRRVGRREKGLDVDVYSFRRDFKATKEYGEEPFAAK